jgi:DNA helicase-2/ATP-dependent DNA helicase PcrA
MTARQREAIEEFDNPVLVLAPPGTGKTKVVVEKYRSCVELWGHGSAIAITFTKKAANEIATRLQETGCNTSWQAGDDPATRRVPTIGTFHSVANRILLLATEAGFYDGPTIVATQGDLDLILGDCLAGSEPDFRPASTGWSSRKAIRDLQTALSRAKNEGYVPTTAGYAYVGGGNKRVVTTLPNAGSAIHSKMVAYQLALADQHLLDFDDALIQAVLMIRQHRSALLPSLRVLIVDEYQDSSALNETMIEVLSARRHLTCCGDDDQAIYRWRGARVEHIQKFADRHEGTKTIVLDQNFRSPPGITVLAERIMRGVPGRLPKTSDSLANVDTSDLPLTVHPYVSRAAIYNPMSTGFESGLADFAARTCQEILKDGTSPRDIVVLTRTNDAATAIRDRLLDRGTNARVSNPNALESLEMKSLLSWLRVLDDPTSPGPVAQLTFTPVGDTTFRDLRNAAAASRTTLPAYLVARLQNGKLRNQRYADFAKAYRKFAAMKDTHDAAELADAICAHIGDTTYSRTDEGRLDYFWRAYASILPVLREGGSLRAGIEILQSRVSDDDLPEHEDFVEISTCHSIKGRQKPVVVICAFSDGILPTKSSVQNGARSPDMHEERRLAFVAVTRAREHIHVISVDGAKSILLDAILDGRSQHRRTTVDA